MHDLEFKARIHSCADQAQTADFLNFCRSNDVRTVDLIRAQLSELALCRNPGMQKAELTDSHLDGLCETGPERYGNWVYYPWLKSAYRILEEDHYIEVRTNRNRNKISLEQQAVFRSKRIGIAGLSVGRALAITLVSQRLMGSIVLADLDELELSNLNRLKAPISDYGLPKTVSAAREIALIDPYIHVECLHQGLRPDNFSDFFGTEHPIDLFVEECDDLEIKLRSRVEARKRGIPVVMEASDRCLVDIERFDLEPNRPILHGIVDEKDLHTVGSLKSFEEKLPLLSKLVDVNNLSEGMKRSVPEIGRSLRTWPQLASDVTYGSGVMAKIIYSIFTGDLRISGRFYIDFEPNRLLLEH